MPQQCNHSFSALLTFLISLGYSNLNNFKETLFFYFKQSVFSPTLAVKMSGNQIKISVWGPTVLILNFLHIVTLGTSLKMEEALKNLFYLRSSHVIMSNALFHSTQAFKMSNVQLNNHLFSNERYLHLMDKNNYFQLK